MDYYKLEAILLDIYATSIDYDPSAESSQVFFATVQNKMHWAAHGHTAAELIASPNASTLHTTVEPPERRL